MVQYAYRRLFPADKVNALLNEAWARGWRVHTFTLNDEGMAATALFQKREYSTRREDSPLERDEGGD